jgi:endonuclease YncB( thermonuclease family)
MADDNNEIDRALGFAAGQHVSADDVGYEDFGDEHADASQEDFIRDEERFYTDREGNSFRQEFDYGRRSAGQDNEGVEDAEVVYGPEEEVAEAADQEVEASPYTPSEEDSSIVANYVHEIEKWEAGASVSNDAVAVGAIQEERLRLSEQIVERGLLGHPDLNDKKTKVSQYLAADLAYNSRPDIADEDYANFVKRRTELREALFGEEYQIDPKVYASATQKVQNAISAKENIEDQYDLLDARREASLENFDNPRFIATIGLHEADLGDELLVDFDRRDLLTDSGARRSDAMAQEFLKAVKSRPAGSVNTAEMVKSFQDMREAGQNMRHNQGSIMNFAKATKGVGDDFEIGIVSLDNVIFSDDVGSEWMSSLSPDEREGMENSAIGFFRASQKTFGKDFKSSDPRAAMSFAVMERSAQRILKNDALVKKLSKVGTPEEVESLFLFSDNYREKQRSRIARDMDDGVIQRMKDDAGDRVTSGVRAGQAESEAAKDTGEKYQLNLDGDHSTKVEEKDADGSSDQQMGDDTPSAETKVSKPHFEIVDGSHIRVSNSVEDAENGKGITLRLDGLTAPPVGAQTKSGMLDAGEESKEHLRELLANGSMDEMDISVGKNEAGESVLKVTMNSGEDLSQRMIRDGYGIPTKDSEGGTRREHLTKQAEAQRRGLWREGMPDLDNSWRAESKGPKLSGKDKREKAVETIGQAMAGSHSDVFRRLSRPETRLFALPVEEWSAQPLVDREIMRIAKTNPGRIEGIYEQNLEILKALRKKKDKLTNPEKLAHDRLTLGSRAMAKSLMDTGHMSPERAQKEDHDLMSRKAKRINMDSLRPLGRKIIKTADAAVKGAEFVGDKSKKSVMTLIDTAMQA